MGNEGSKLKGLITDKNAVELNDFWALYNAESPTTTNEEGRQLLSIFQGEPIVKGQLWANCGPMERAIKNLMIYRHPYILKYITTWEQSGQKYVATERVRPLCDVLAQQSDIEVCLGLRTILCSLIFLIEKALARHLNICSQSIYVTDNGSWRLFGFEYVWKGKELNKQLLDLAHSFRHQSAIDVSNRDQLFAFEQFAFAKLCEEILEKCAQRNVGAGDADTGTPYVQEFRTYCSTHLMHSNTELRPKLSAVLLHPYFNHEFVLIHSFLFELPLKSVQERQQFFSGLVDRLRYFDEQMVASQFTENLLSRMVLLDPTAQVCVTPHVLRTKTDNGTAALFSPQTYVQYLLPQILKMFRLRDAQIRLILLEYFMDYVRLLSDEQLQHDILPHLIIGMNDTNDVLVAKTLRSLADLVPILGAATVLSSQQSRIFSDGRPHAAVVEPRSITPVMNGSAVDVDVDDYMVSGSPLPTEGVTTLSLQMRLSPDGGEDDKTIINLNDTLSNKPLEICQNSNSNSHKNSDSTSFNITSCAAQEQTLVNDSSINAVEEEEAWSDWDATDELQRLHVKGLGEDNPNTVTNTQDDLLLNNLETQSSASSHATQATQQSQTDSYRTACSTLSRATSSSKMAPPSKNIIDDLNALDIQIQVQQTITTLNTGSTEFDFFKDMEPIIKPSLSSPNEAEVVQVDASRFAASALASNEGDLDDEADQGWGMGIDEEDDVDIVWGNHTNDTRTGNTV